MNKRIKKKLEKRGHSFRYKKYKGISNLIKKLQTVPSSNILVCDYLVGMVPYRNGEELSKAKINKISEFYKMCTKLFQENPDIVIPAPLPMLFSNTNGLQSFVVTRRTAPKPITHTPDHDRIINVTIVKSRANYNGKNEPLTFLMNTERGE